MINLPDRKLSSVLKLSGNPGAATGLPTYLIATIILVVTVVLFSIGAVYYKFVYKKRSKQRVNNKPMAEVWAAENVIPNTPKLTKDTNNVVNNALTQDSVAKSDLIQVEIIDNDASDISGLECFQYNSEFIDMEDTNQIKPLSEKGHHNKL